MRKNKRWLSLGHLRANKREEGQEKPGEGQQKKRGTRWGGWAEGQQRKLPGTGQGGEVFALPYASWGAKRIDDEMMICCLNLLPYFISKLFAWTVGTFVFIFSESIWQKTQRKQLDVYVRQWDCNKQIVMTRFLASVFMGQGHSENLVKHFHKLGRWLDENDIQIGVNGLDSP